MENKHACLKDDWTIRGTADKCILFNFKKGLCEDRLSISRDAYEVLRLATGEYTCAEIGKISGIDPLPYFEYLLDMGVIELSNIPKNKTHHLSDLYQGKDFLGRIMLHITGRCNLVCKHCYLANKNWGEELTFVEITDLIRQAAELNVASFSITGGEPFVRGDLFNILQELDKWKMKIEGLFTNATLITDDFLDSIANLQEFPFFVSINGSFTEAHDNFVGTEGSFDQSLKTIRRLVDRDIKVFANTSLNTFLDDDRLIEKFYKLIKSLKIYRWRVSSPFLEGSWKDNFLKFGVSIERELQIFSNILELWLDGGKPFDLELGHIFRYVNGVYSQMTYSESDYVCDYFRERIVILPDGGISACPLLITPHYLVGNIRDQSLKEIWESENMRYYKDLKIQDIMNEKCRSCDKLARCGIGCRANSVLRGGRYEDIDPEICEINLSPVYNGFEGYLQRTGLTARR